MRHPVKSIAIALLTLAIMLAGRLIGGALHIPAADWDAFAYDNTRCTELRLNERAWLPMMDKGNQKFQSQYQCGAIRLYFDAALYFDQSADNEAVGYANQVIANTWSYRFGEEVVRLGPNRQFLSRRQLLGKDFVVAWKSYLIGGEATPNELQAKLAEARSLIGLQRWPTAVVSIAVQYPEDDEMPLALLSSGADQLTAWYLTNARGKGAQ